MIRKEIIELAREAGMSEYNEIIGWCGQPVVLERFANIVAAKERERCAMVCEDIYTNGDFVGGWVKVAANKIRSLK